jgi:hypothetical protein
VINFILPTQTLTKWQIFSGRGYLRQGQTCNEDDFRISLKEKDLSFDLPVQTFAQSSQVELIPVSLWFPVSKSSSLYQLVAYSIPTGVKKSRHLL